ncbi:ATP-binding protein [Fulvivirga aurantia]|uniref:ATP-binding protein n=1 Tax=Fulvivirga aurantia TaxID=2529383 RepID=UPI001CA453D5|nr:ATP-binding protein [Fulvivirga aurantia]
MLKKLIEHEGFAYLIITNDNIKLTDVELPVLEVTDSASIQRDQVYIIQNNKQIKLGGGRVKVEDKKTATESKAQESLYKSLALNYGSRAVAIELSPKSTYDYKGLEFIVKLKGLALIDKNSFNSTHESGGLKLLESGEMVEHITKHASTPLNHPENLNDKISGIDSLEELVAIREEQFRTMANSIPQLAWMTDSSGYIYWYNNRWYDYTGTTLDEMKGWGWMKVHHPDHVDRVVEKFNNHVEAGEAWEDTFPLKSKDGEFRWFLSRAELIKDEDGNITNWFGTNTDITDQMELESSLKNAVSKLEEADKRKNDFLSLLGHELRNPLASLKGSVDMLDMGIATQDQVMGIMKRGISTMSQLLDDLLDLSRISRNTVKLKRAVFNVSDLLTNKKQEILQLVNPKDIELKTDIEDNLWVNGDSTRIDQIVSNLVSNAIKYTQENGKLQLKSWADGNQIKIQIADSGIGIDKETLEKVFDPFYQKAPEGKANSGMGIGLTLVKELAEMHDGDITAHSDGIGKGSTFTLSLPQAPQIIDSGSETNNNVRIKNNLKVVLVDDNEDLLMTFGSILQKMGCEIHRASNGQEGIDLISLEKPAVAFVDIGLPDMTGYDVVKSLRANGYNGRLFAASGYGHEDAIDQAQAAGFDKHFAKPLDLQIIKVLLSDISENQ